jgi:phosphate/phosphite/phosphonate ABC transporter binding protein
MRLLVCCLVLLSGCEPMNERSSSSPRQLAQPLPVFSPPQGFTQLKVGVIPALAPETVAKNYQRFGEYLSRQLSVPVEILVPRSYSEAVTQLEAQAYDLVSLSPYAYTMASQQTPLNCLVQSIADGSATASGYLFVRDDSPRKTLDDVRGARLALVDPKSTTGYLYPAKLLSDRGIALDKDFSSVEFFGNHEAVLLAIFDGRADVGATYQGSFAALRRARGIDTLTFRVIAKTARAPRDIYCLRKALPAEIGEAISRAMLALTGSNRAGREILGPMEVNGFTPADDAAYAGVRSVAAAVSALPGQPPRQ